MMETKAVDVLPLKSKSTSWPVEDKWRAVLTRAGSVAPATADIGRSLATRWRT